MFHSARSAIKKVLGVGVIFQESSVSWKDLAFESGSYADPNLVSRLASHSKLAWTDLTRFERDGFFLKEPRFQWEALTAILRVASTTEGMLRVVDFVGSFATLARQLEQIFANGHGDERGRAGIEWLVVEQEEVVNRGPALGLKNVSFFSDLEEVLHGYDPQVFLASGSLQYLESPYAMLNLVSGSDIEHVILDRTAVNVKSAEDVLCLQKVGRTKLIANGTETSKKSIYPAWVLSEEKLLAALKEEFNIYFSFNSLDGSAFTDRGTAFSRKGYFGARK